MPEAGKLIHGVEDVAVKAGGLAPGVGVVNVRLKFPLATAPPYGPERLTAEGDAPMVALAAGFTVMESDTWEFWAELSNAWTTSGKVPALVGVPAITPLPGFSDNPAGSAPVTVPGVG